MKPAPTGKEWCIKLLISFGKVWMPDKDSNLD